MKKVVIPNVDFWPRADFLSARHAQMAAQKEADAKQGISESVIYLGDSDEIVCDDCNAEITDDVINLVMYGRRAVCNACYQQTHKVSEPTYRLLNDDGTLGPIVKLEKD